VTLIFVWYKNGMETRRLGQTRIYTDTRRTLHLLAAVQQATPAEMLDRIIGDWLRSQGVQASIGGDRALVDGSKPVWNTETQP
jgi:hypothetical protein